MNAFEEKFSTALNELFVTRVRALTRDDIKLTHFTHDEYCIYAHFTYSQEMLNARDWNFSSYLGEYPVRDTITDKMYVKRIYFTKQGLRNPESIKRKRESVTTAMLQYLQERSSEIERDMIQRVQERIDRYLESAREYTFTMIDSQLSDKDSYETLNHDYELLERQRKYEKAKKEADAAHESLIYRMNIVAFKEVKEILEQLPEDMKKAFTEKFDNSKYFVKKTLTIR